MKELQNRAGRALLALLANDSKKALEELNVYKLTLDEDGEPILVPHLREDRPLGPASSIEGQEVWAIGLDLCNGQFGMTHGPARSIDEMLEVQVDSEDACIIHFIGDGTEEITHRWRNGEWLEALDFRPKVNPFEAGS